MTTYYVSTNGSDSGKGTSSSPWRTINKAMKANLKSGDEVVVKSGTYKEAVHISKDGITLRSDVPGGAKIVPPANKIGVNIGANHVTVDGFEVHGSTLGGIVGNGIHHVKVIDSIVHDNQSNGILLMKSDFITVEGNVAYDNASNGAPSGISIFHPVNVTGSQSNSGYRIIVRNNVSYSNQNQNGAHTDGNGIIFDDFKSVQDAKIPAYKFASLIEKNLVYQNGGAGIMVFNSENVTVRGNTAWHNNLDNKSNSTWRGELQNQRSDDITWVNNVAVADKTVNKYNTAIGSFSNSGEKNTGIAWQGNTTFNGKSGDASVSTNNGNAAPNPSNNHLGDDPELNYSDIQSMAKSMGASSSGSSSTSSADADTGTSDAGTGATDKSGGPGNDKLYGGSGADELHGNGGNDQLYGKGGNDKLYGGDGADKLYGNVGDDYLSGGNGNDLLRGGEGKDVLIGGAGADDFSFLSIAQAGKGSGRDVIEDFSHAQGDDIDLSGIDANTKASGNQAFSFIGGQDFSGKAGQLQYKNGIVAGDINGDKVADFHIEIANHSALAANDFIL